MKPLEAASIDEVRLIPDWAPISHFVHHSQNIAEIKKQIASKEYTHFGVEWPGPELSGSWLAHIVLGFKDEQGHFQPYVTVLNKEHPVHPQGPPRDFNHPFFCT